MKYAIAFIIAFLLVGCIAYENHKNEKQEMVWPVQPNTQKISFNEVLEILMNVSYYYSSILIMDKWYYLVNESFIKEAINVDKTNERNYTEDVFDCDNFAFTLWYNITSRYAQLAFGVVFIRTHLGSHALNFFIDENKEVRFVEPQWDSIDPYNISKYQIISIIL